jgi:cell division protein ZapA
MKQLDVQIMGNSYRLLCPEGGESRLRDAVAKVDAAMCKIRDAGKVKARDRIAVLAALNLAFETGPAQTPAPVASDNAEMDHPNLAYVLQRLNTVLGEDGQLI